MPAAAIRLNQAQLLLDPAGLLVWPARSLVAVADLHLEKGSCFAARGQFLPPYDSRETLIRLAQALARLRPARVVALGDSFHDAGGPARMDAQSAALLADLTARHDWLWLAGNHDPDPRDARWGGGLAETLALDGLCFRHQALPDAAAGEVSGHFHPKARLATRGGTLRARCFVSDPTRLILPAFGAFTGGLDIDHPALRGLFTDQARLHLLARGRVLTVPIRPISERAA